MKTTPVISKREFNLEICKFPNTEYSLPLKTTLNNKPAKLKDWYNLINTTRASTMSNNQAILTFKLESIESNKKEKITRAFRLHTPIALFTVAYLDKEGNVILCDSYLEFLNHLLSNNSKEIVIDFLAQPEKSSSMFFIKWNKF